MQTVGAAAVRPTENQTTSVVEFRPRASSLACQWIAEAGLTIAEERIARAYAAHARFATAADCRRHKVRPGEVFAYPKAETIAREIGRARQTVHNLTGAIKRLGVIEVRQCDRTRRSIVFRQREHETAGGKAAGRAIGRATGKAVREPRTEPQIQPRSERRTRTRARLTCSACGRSWPADHGPDCYECHRPWGKRPAQLEAGSPPNVHGPETAPNDTGRLPLSGDAFGDAERQRAARLEHAERIFAKRPDLKRCQMERGGTRCAQVAMAGSVFCASHAPNRCEGCGYLTRQCRCKGATDAVPGA